MPRKRIAAHLRAARTCNTVLTSLMTYRNRDSAIEQLEHEIREQRIAALLAGEQAVGQTSDRPFTRPQPDGSSAAGRGETAATRSPATTEGGAFRTPGQATLRRSSPLFNEWAYGLPKFSRSRQWHPEWAGR
jgi:hypothetical protein